MRVGQTFDPDLLIHVVIEVFFGWLWQFVRGLVGIGRVCVGFAFVGC
jgi:hypothetical protein